MINIMSGHPAYDHCPGCVDGSCASGMAEMPMVYPPYYYSDQFVPCIPMGPEYFAYGYGYGPHPMFNHYPGPQFQAHHPNQPYHWQRPQRSRRGSKNKAQMKTLSVQNEAVMSASVESAIMCVKTNPQATLFSIEDTIAEVATFDDGASRFIQDRIQNGSVEEQHLALKSALTSFGMLCRDYRGHRMIQALIRCGSHDIKKEVLAAIYKEDPLNLAMDKHGCRVIQSAITSTDNKDLYDLVSKFQGHVLTLIHNPNGNHVVQRIVEAARLHVKSSEPEERDDSASQLSAQIQSIIVDITQHIKTLSVHIYGCRVVQRALEYCNEDQKRAVLTAVLECKEMLMKDQYGNYVLQQAYAIGGNNVRDELIKFVSRGTGPDSLLELSKHKFASNFIEKLIQAGTASQRDMIIKEFLRSDDGSDVCIAVHMAKDNIANYVIKTAMACAKIELKDQILKELSRNLVELSKYPQASYIFSKESASVVSSASSMASAM